MCIALSLDLGLVLDFTDVVISPLKKKHNASGIGLRNVKIQYLDKDVKKKSTYMWLQEKSECDG